MVVAVVVNSPKRTRPAPEGVRIRSDEAVSEVLVVMLQTPATFTFGTYTYPVPFGTIPMFISASTPSTFKIPHCPATLLCSCR